MRRALLFSLFWCGMAQVNAQWIADPTVNNPVVTVAQKGTTSISGYATAPDNDGGMFIVWIDSRNSATSGDDIFVTRLKKDGTIAAGFNAAGNVVCNAAGNQSNVAVVPDGSGGVNIVWQDARNNASTSSDIYGLKIKGDGTRLGPENGFLISGTSFGENSPALATVGTDKVAVVWRYTGTSTGVDLAMNFADFATQTVLLASNVQVSEKTGTQSNQVIIADGSGSAIIVWTDGRVSNQNIHLYGQKINQTGALLWGAAGSEADGLQLTNATGNALLPQIVSDGAGGAVVAFGSTRVATDNANIYALRIDASGANVWAENGVNVCVAATNQANARLVKSGNRYIVAWADRRESTNPPANSNNNDIFVQSLNAADGSTNWTADGVQLTKLINNQPNSTTDGFEMIEDGLGGAYVIWDDGRNGTSNLDVYAQYVKTGGTLSWAENGMAVATLSGANQNWPRAVISENEKVMVIFRDGRTNTSAEIFASLIEPSGVLPVEFLNISARPFDKGAEVIWNTALESGLSHYEVERSRDGNGFSAIGEVKAQLGNSSNEYSFIDAQAFTGTNYYRVKSVDKDGKFKFSPVVKAAIEPIANDKKLLIYPNPARGSVTVQLNKNVPSGLYIIRLVDAAGRIAMQQQINYSGSSSAIGISLTKTGRGNYKLQIVSITGKVVSTEALIIH